MSLERAVEMMTSAPCDVAGIKNKGRLRPGADADIAIADLDANWTIDNDGVLSRCGWDALSWAVRSSRASNVPSCAVRIFSGMGRSLVSRVTANKLDRRNNHGNAVWTLCSRILASTQTTIISSKARSWPKNLASIRCGCAITWPLSHTPNSRSPTSRFYESFTTFDRAGAQKTERIKLGTGLGNSVFAIRCIRRPSSAR